METCPDLGNVTVVVTLQWSHGPKAVETGPSGSPSRWDAGFNGATARRPWRQGRPPGACGQDRDASMEPRPEGRGDVGKFFQAVAQRRASMEPRPEGRGDRDVLKVV